MSETSTDTVVDQLMDNPGAFLGDLLHVFAGVFGVALVPEDSQPEQKLFRFERPEGNDELENATEVVAAAGQAEMSLLNTGEATYLVADNAPPSYEAATLNKMSEKNVKKPLELYFGEFRLVCLTHLQTLLLLMRATGKYHLLRFICRISLIVHLPRLAASRAT
jgi:hypothetical protein